MAADREAARRYQREWYAKNKERVSARNRERARNNYDPEKARLRRIAEADKIKARRDANRKQNNERSRQWYAANKDRARANARLKKFGLTTGQIDAMRTAQGGACAICRQEFSALPSRHEHVDHCHATRAIRGLLCHGCNVSLGQFRDDPTILARAIQYLTGAGQ
jgi:hypothetical protein